MTPETRIMLEQELTISLAVLRQYMDNENTNDVWENIEHYGEYECAYSLLKHYANKHNVVVPNLENSGRLMGLVK